MKNFINLIALLFLFCFFNCEEYGETDATFDIGLIFKNHTTNTYILSVKDTEKNYVNHNLYLLNPLSESGRTNSLIYTIASPNCITNVSDEHFERHISAFYSIKINDAKNNFIFKVTNNNLSLFTREEKYPFVTYSRVLDITENTFKNSKLGTINENN